MNNTQSPEVQPQFEEIRTLAYHLWRQANGSSGQDLDFWLQAEQQLMMRPPVKEAPPANAADTSGRTKAETPSNSKSASPSKSAGRRAAEPNGNAAGRRQPGIRKRSTAAR